MGVYDALNYVLFTNPISSNTSYYATNAASTVSGYLGLQSKNEVKMAAPVPLWKLAIASGPYIRLAALSGAAAVTLGAYGAHRHYPEPYEKLPDQKQVFETANRFHFIHTLALLGLPMCRAPWFAATFFISGILLFCGSCYYYAFTGDKQMNKLTPFGGICFIVGWLGMCI